MLSSNLIQITLFGHTRIAGMDYWDGPGLGPGLVLIYCSHDLSYWSYDLIYWFHGLNRRSGS